MEIGKPSQFKRFLRDLGDPDRTRELVGPNLPRREFRNPGYQCFQFAGIVCQFVGHESLKHTPITSDGTLEILSRNAENPIGA